MKLTITIDMDNDAFRDPHRYDEVRRILENAVDRIDLGAADVVKLRDSNGNTVGHAEVTK